MSSYGFRIFGFNIRVLPVTDIPAHPVRLAESSMAIIICTTIRALLSFPVVKRMPGRSILPNCR